MRDIGSECPGIRGHRVVSEVTRDHRPQPFALFRDGVVHAFTQSRLDLLESCPHPVAPRLSLGLKCTASRLAADEDELREGEGYAFGKPHPCIVDEDLVKA